MVTELSLSFTGDIKTFRMGCVWNAPGGNLFHSTSILILPNISHFAFYVEFCEHSSTLPRNIDFSNLVLIWTLVLKSCYLSIFILSNICRPSSEICLITMDWVNLGIFLCLPILLWLALFNMLTKKGYKFDFLVMCLTWVYRLIQFFCRVYGHLECASTLWTRFWVSSSRSSLRRTETLPSEPCGSLKWRSRLTGTRRQSRWRRGVRMTTTLAVTSCCQRGLPVPR